MTPDCLLKAQTILTKEAPEVVADLERAYRNGDSVLWNSLLDDASQIVTLKKRRAIIDMSIRVNLLEHINERAKQGVPRHRALMDLLSGAGSNQKAGVTSLDKEILAVRGEYISKLTDMIHAGRAKFLGLSRSHNTDLLRNVAKAIFKDVDANISKETQLWVDAWSQVIEELRVRFNKAGGNIPRFKKYYIPTSHDARRLLKTSKEEWVAFADEHFDILKQEGSKIPTPDQKKLILGNIYDKITGLKAEELTLADLAIDRPKAMANKHTAKRVLQPKSGDAWLSYNRRFGRHSNPIQAMVEHIDGYATEIAAMEKFGTNPTTIFKELLSGVRQRTGKLSYLHAVERTYDQIMGANPPGTDLVTDVFQGLQNFQTITKLPLSGITATSDTIYMTTRARFNGMSSVKVMARILKNLNPASFEDRKIAGRLGLLLDYAMDKASALNRFNDSVGYGMLSRAVDMSTRLSGMNHWTNTAKMVFGLEFLSVMAHAAETSVPKELLRTFERYGISEADWAALKMAVETIKGSTFINPMHKSLSPELRKRVLAMIQEETMFAVPEPNAKAHAAAAFWTQKNTIANRSIKLLNQFKPFSVSVFLTHMGTILDRHTPFPTRIGYATSLLASSAVIGTLILQAKEIAKGRTFRDLTPELVAEGVLQGGAGGIMMDIIGTDPDKYGGLPAYAFGPTGGTLTSLHKLISKTITTKGGVKTKLIPGVLKTLQQDLFITQNPLLRGAVERMLWDNLNKELDPNFYKKQRRYRKWLRSRGQKIIKFD